MLVVGGAISLATCHSAGRGELFGFAVEKGLTIGNAGGAAVHLPSLSWRPREAAGVGPQALQSEQIHAFSTWLISLGPLQGAWRLPSSQTPTDKPCSTSYLGSFLVQLNSHTRLTFGSSRRCHRHQHHWVTQEHIDGGGC